jgi:hypothetical protein
MEVKEEVRTFPGTVVMQGHFGPVSGAYQVYSRLRYAAWGYRGTPRGVRHYLGGILLRLFPDFYFTLIGFLF